MSQEAREGREQRRIQQELEEADTITDWAKFAQYSGILKDITDIPKDGNVSRSMTLIKLSKDSPPSIIYSMEITERYEITCYLRATKIPVLKNSFDKRLTKYSQLNSILSMVEIQSLNFTQESEKCSQQVRRLRESSQLDLIASKPEGRRYTTAQYRQAIDLCLRGRNSYKALRKFCIFPSMKSIHKLFGCMSTGAPSANAER